MVARSVPPFCLLCLFCHCVFPQQDSLHSRDSLPDYLITSLNGPDEELVMDDQETNSLLSANGEIFQQFATFSFGQGRFRPRGLSGKDQQITLNGIWMNHPESGQASWSSWSGLNDVTRFQESGAGITDSPYGFSGAAGYSQIHTSASAFKKGTRVSLAASNYLFGSRQMITHATGFLSGGWSLALSASRRYGKQYVPGTRVNANSFFLSADKILNKQSQLNLTFIAAATERAGSGNTLKETAASVGTNYYNPSWGFQAGTARSAAVRSVAKPIALLNHTWSSDRSTSLNTTLSWSFGQSSSSGLNWYQAQNPRPDYYRYLPSWAFSSGDTTAGNRLSELWRDELNTRQINWDLLTQLNRANLFSSASTNGQPNSTETRARYILEKRKEKLSSFQIASTWQKRINRLSLSAGFSGLHYSNRKFKEVEDLLGADYWLDLDQFAPDLTPDAFTQQNNIEEPNKKIYKGDLFGYNYKIHIRKVDFWAQAEYRFKQLDVFGAVTISASQIWKESFMANGKFPSTSKGLSKKIAFVNYGFKSGLTYKLPRKQFITAALCYLNRPPTVNNLFLSPDVRNDLLPAVSSETNFSSELSYVYRSSRWRFCLTGYFNQSKNQTRIKTYWSDPDNTFINYAMTNLDQTNYGMEAGLEKTFFDVNSIQLATGVGDYFYSNRPTAQAWQNTTNAALLSDRKLYLKNYAVGGSPQTVLGVTYRYSSPQRWYASLNFRYFDRIYTELNPDRRSAEAIEKFSSDDEDAVRKIVTQERLPAWWTFNSQLGTFLHLSRKTSLSVHVSLNNLLNNKNTIVSGVEQMRWDLNYPERFANRYAWLPGFTWLAGTTFNF